MLTSVVIPTYNRRQTLSRTLAAVLDQVGGKPGYEVVVVDDCSGDDTQPFMESMQRRIDNLIYLRHDKNRGRSVTRNHGALAAHGEILVFLDDDNVPENQCIAAHVREHEARAGRRVAIMGNVAYAAEAINGRNFGHFMHSRYLGYRPMRELASLDLENLPPRLFGTLNCSLRRADFLAVGMFDESFRYYGGEDEFLGYSLWSDGVRIVFGRDARSIHYDDVTIDRVRKKAIETGRWGLKELSRKAPEYVASTRMRFLLPVDWSTDSLSRIAAKFAVRVLANRRTTRLCEWWATLSDTHPALYSPPLYRWLLASWMTMGYRDDGNDTPIVTYGDAP